jgi:hypothetical protein
VEKIGRRALVRVVGCVGFLTLALGACSSRVTEQEAGESRSLVSTAPARNCTSARYGGREYGSARARQSKQRLPAHALPRACTWYKSMTSQQLGTRPTREPSLQVRGSWVERVFFVFGRAELGRRPECL